MSIIQFPDGLQMTKQTWGQKRNDLSFSSMFGSQSIEISPPVWEMSLSPPPYLKTESGIFESLMMNLRGKENQACLSQHAQTCSVGNHARNDGICCECGKRRDVDQRVGNRPSREKRYWQGISSGSELERLNR